MSEAQSCVKRLHVWYYYTTIAVMDRTAAGPARPCNRTIPIGGSGATERQPCSAKATRNNDRFDCRVDKLLRHPPFAALRW
jgi:hypothetical protein